MPEGHPPKTVVSHLIQYAPTPECFAAGITAAIDDPSAGLATASQLRAQPDRLAAIADRYGLAPGETGSILRDVGAPTAQVVAMLGAPCDYDDLAVGAAWRGRHRQRRPRGRVPWFSVAASSRSGGNEISSAEELLAVLPLPGRTEANPRELFDQALSHTGPEQGVRRHLARCGTLERPGVKLSKPIAVARQ